MTRSEDEVQLQRRQVQALESIAHSMQILTGEVVPVAAKKPQMMTQTPAPTIPAMLREGEKVLKMGEPGWAEIGPDGKPLPDDSVEPLTDEDSGEQ